MKTAVPGVKPLQKQKGRTLCLVRAQLRDSYWTIKGSGSEIGKGRYLWIVRSSVHGTWTIKKSPVGPALLGLLLSQCLETPLSWDLETARFKPGSSRLQSTALPLSYRATVKTVRWMTYSCFLSPPWFVLSTSFTRHGGPF